MRIPFGKYKGEPLRNLPDWYLEWLYDQDWLYDYLREGVEREYDRRFINSQNGSDAFSSLTPEAQQLAAGIVRIGYRELAKQLHPDRNGADYHMMAALNEAISWLRKQVRS